VRKISAGEGVERTFQTYSPVIASIEVKRKGAVRRAKLYYLRERSASRTYQGKAGGTRLSCSRFFCDKETELRLPFLFCAPICPCTEAAVRYDSIMEYQPN